MANQAYNNATEQQDNKDNEHKLMENIQDTTFIIPPCVLVVYLFKATNLPTHDFYYQLQTSWYVTLHYGDGKDEPLARSTETKNLDEDDNPIWNEYVAVTLPQQTLSQINSLTIKFWDKGHGRPDKLIGKTLLDLEQLFEEQIQMQRQLEHKLPTPRNSVLAMEYHQELKKQLEHRDMIYVDTKLDIHVDPSIQHQVPVASSPSHVIAKFKFCILPLDNDRQINGGEIGVSHGAEESVDICTKFVQMWTLWNVSQKNVRQCGLSCQHGIGIAFFVNILNCLLQNFGKVFLFSVTSSNLFSIEDSECLFQTSLYHNFDISNPSIFFFGTSACTLKFFIWEKHISLIRFNEDKLCTADFLLLYSFALCDGLITREKDKFCFLFFFIDQQSSVLFVFPIDVWKTHDHALVGWNRDEFKKAADRQIKINNIIGMLATYSLQNGVNEKNGGNDEKNEKEEKDEKYEKEDKYENEADEELKKRTQPSHMNELKRKLIQCLQEEMSYLTRNNNPYAHLINARIDMLKKTFQTDIERRKEIQQIKEDDQKKKKKKRKNLILFNPLKSVLNITQYFNEMKIGFLCQHFGRNDYYMTLKMQRTMLSFRNKKLSEASDLQEGIGKEPLMSEKVTHILQKGFRIKLTPFALTVMSEDNANCPLPLGKDTLAARPLWHNYFTYSEHFLDTLLSLSYLLPNDLQMFINFASAISNRPIPVS
ncbi:hypothetical protein RFI_13173 [Reticulomyxa filosa]|uniref:C2 domain-containing protein n=1 Tax=Reticulomyxa filosa TaxID=46433 RepID=X6NCF5_RETFI|nr:hypothetical protein RFI_13173 [Reticulomyxa filosa]|eukprot:ETO23985.1 hypothetical protein RFI_13173 [Reticulomyxa filosa]